MTVRTKSELKERVDAVITSNGKRGITAAAVRELLKDVIDSLKHRNS